MTSPLSHLLGTIALVGFLATTTVARAEDAPPDWGLPAWITVSSSTVTSDTRADDPSKGSVVSNVGLVLAPPNPAGATLALDLVGTWTGSTGRWTFTSSSTTSGSNTFGPFAVENISLDERDTGWLLTATVVPAGVDASRVQALGLPVSMTAHVDKTGVHAVFPSPVSRSLGGGMTLDLTGLEPKRGSGGGGTTLAVVASLASGTTRLPGDLALDGDEVTFTPTTTPNGSPSVAAGPSASFNVGRLTIPDSSSGKGPTVSGTIVATPASPAAAALGAPVPATLSFTQQGSRFHADLSKSPLALSLGSGPGLAITSTTLTVPGDGTAATWTADTSLPVAEGSDVSGTLHLDGSTLTLDSLQGLPLLAGLTLTLSRSATAPHGTAWTATLKGKVTGATLAGMLADAGLPGATLDGDLTVTGGLTGSAIRVVCDTVPTLPLSIPDWVPVHPDSVRQVAVTRQLHGGSATVVDLRLAFDFSRIPGMPTGLAPTSMSALLGKGIAPPGASRSPSGVGGSWFHSALTDLMPDYAKAYGWSGAADVTSNATPGLVMGPLSGSATAGPTSIALPGVGSLDIDGFTVGYTGSTWTCSGHLALTPTSTPTIFGVALPSTDHLAFELDEKRFHASTPFVHDLRPVPGVDFGLTSLDLSRPRSASAWSFSVPASFAWTGRDTTYFRSDGAFSFDDGVKFTADGPTTFAVPGGYSVDVADLVVTDTAGAIGGSGKATMPIPAGSRLAPVLGALGSLEFGVGFSPKGIAFKTTTTLPTLTFGGGKDVVAFKTVTIETLPAGGLHLGGNAAVTLGSKSFDATLDVSPGAFDVTITNAALVEGIDSLDLTLAMITGADGSKSYTGAFSGTIPASSFATLYSHHGLAPAPGAGTGPATVTGSAGPGRFDIDFHDIPMPAMPEGGGLSFTAVDELGISVDHTAGTQSFTLTADLSIGAVLSGIRVSVAVDEAGGTPPDITVKALLDASGKGPSVTIPTVGCFTFTEIDAGRKTGTWSAGGQFVWHTPTAWSRLHLGSFSLPGTVEFTFDGDATSFSATATLPSPSNPVTHLLPGVPLDITGLSIREVATPSGHSLQPGLLAKMGIPGGGDPVGGRVVFAAGGVDFQADTPGFGFAIDLTDPATKHTLADLKVSDLSFSLGTEGIGLSGDVVLTLPPVGKGKLDIMKTALGTDTFTGSLSGSPSAFFVDIEKLAIEETVDLGHLGSVKFDVSELKFGSDGTAGGTGKVTMLGEILDLDLGIEHGSPYVGVVVEKSSPLVAKVGEAFEFRLSGPIHLGSNLLGFATASVGGVDAVLRDADDNLLGELGATGFVYYLPSPVIPTGMVFFQNFHGYMDVAGLKANMDMSLPDPMSSANAEAVLEDLFNLLANGSSGDSFDNLTAPSFGLRNVAVDFPAGAEGAMQAMFGTSQTDYVLVDQFEVKLSTFLDMIKLPTPKQIALELFEDVKGNHQVNVCGFHAASDIGLGENGFHAAFDLGQQVPASDPVVSFSGSFGGDIGQDGSWSFSDNGTLRTKTTDGKWHTASSLTLKLSSAHGFQVDAKLLGATGHGTISTSGYSFSGDLDTRSHGTGMHGTASLSNTKFDLDVSIDVAGHYVGGGKFSVKDGQITIEAEETSKHANPRFHLHSTFGVGHAPKIEFDGWFHYDHGGHLYKLEGDIDVDGEHFKFDIVNKGFGVIPSTIHIEFNFHTKKLEKATW